MSAAAATVPASTATGAPPSALVLPSELPMSTKVFAFATMCVGMFIALLEDRKSVV